MTTRKVQSKKLSAEKESFRETGPELIAVFGKDLTPDEIADQLWKKITEQQPRKWS